MIFLDFGILIISVKQLALLSSKIVVFSVLVLLISSYTQTIYSTSSSGLRQSAFLAIHERPVYFQLWICIYLLVINAFLNLLVRSILLIFTTLNFFMNAIVLLVSFPNSEVYYKHADIHPGNDNE